MASKQEESRYSYKRIKRDTRSSERRDLSQGPPQALILRCIESAMSVGTGQMVGYEITGIIHKNLDFKNPAASHPMITKRRSPLQWDPHLEVKIERKLSCSVITRPLNTGCGSRARLVIVP